MQHTVPNPFEDLFKKLHELTVEVRELRKRIDHQPEREAIGGVEFASSILGLSPRTIYKLTHRRTIPHLKKGGRLYFKKSELEAWLNEGRRPTSRERAIEIMEGQR